MPDQTLACFPQSPENTQSLRADPVSPPLSALTCVQAICCVLLAGFLASTQAAPPSGIHSPDHPYFQTPAQDPFSRWLESQPDDRADPPASGELERLQTVLKGLAIPASSQMLVFSATSFQTGLISARNPRAIYFNEDNYVGFVPDGKLEVLSVDPKLGPIFHLVHSVPRGTLLRSERSARCINCHAPEEKGGIPLLVVESMVPGLSGGGEKSFRTDATGHSIPLSERMGGWHVTGAKFAHRGNLLMETKAGLTRDIPLPPGKLFSWDRYPVKTSDALAHLLHEHQLGFINRCVEARYRLESGSMSNREKELDFQASELLRYALFTDEAQIPAGGIQADSAFRQAFLERRIPDSKGLSLRDLDLSNRLFKYRCSYMIYSNAFTGLPEDLKKRFFSRLHSVLISANPKDSHLSLPERRALIGILSETLPDLVSLWGTVKKG